MQVLPQPISYIPFSASIQSRTSSSSQHWYFPTESKNFEQLEVHFSILRILILTRETLPLTSVESDEIQFMKKLNHLARR